MTLRPGSYRPDEVGGADAPIRDSELAEAYAAARLLERAMPTDPVTRSGDFSDRVMAAVVREPAPRPAGFLGALLAHPGPASFVASVRSAWATAAGAAGRPVQVRAAAMAYVLAVLVAAVSLTGVAAYGTAGAIGGLLGQDRSSDPSGLVTSPSPSPSPSDDVGPSESAEPSDSAEPSESAEPSGSVGPEDSLKPGETPRPTSTRSPAASPSPDGSGEPSESPSPSSSDDSGGGSGSPSNTPRPSDTPKPSETPH